MFSSKTVIEPILFELGITHERKFHLGGGFDNVSDHVFGDGKTATPSIARVLARVVSPGLSTGDNVEAHAAGRVEYKQDTRLDHLGRRHPQGQDKQTKADGEPRAHETLHGEEHRDDTAGTRIQTSCLVRTRKTRPNQSAVLGG